MQKLNNAEVLTLASFFESISGSNQDLPTAVWANFEANYNILKEYVVEFESAMYNKYMELFPSDIEVDGPERLKKDNAYAQYKRHLHKQEVEVELVTMSKKQFIEDVPSMKGVRGIYLFLKYIANEQA